MGFILTLVLFVVTFVLSELLKPKPKIENARPANLGDFSFPTATEGRVVPLVWGTVKLEGPNVVWYGDLSQVPITRKIRPNLWSSKTIITGYGYYLGFQMGLCRGTVNKLLRIWVGEEVLWSGEVNTDQDTIDIDDGTFLGGELGAGGLIGTLRFHPGSETQAINTYLSDFQSQGGDTPAYRGTCHVVWEGGFLGTSTTIDPWRFEVQRIPNGLGLVTPTVNTYDANPMNVLYEAMTDADWGLGFDPLDIDTVNFAAAAATLATEGNGMSMIIDTATEMVDFIKEIERQIDGVIVLNRTTGKWQVNLARGGYTVGTLPNANESSVLEVRDFSRGAWDETTNEIRVNFADRQRDYFSTFAAAQDMANVMIQGVSVVAQINYPAVKDADLANNLAWRDLRGLSRPLAKATLVVDRTFYNVNPGDVIRWNNTELGFTDLPMRVTRVDTGTLEEGGITLEVVEDIYTFEAASFAPPQPSDWVRPADTLADIATADRKFFEVPKAIADRDPEFPGVYNRIAAFLRSQGNGEVAYDLYEGTNLIGEGAGYVLAAELNANVPAGNNGVDITLDCDLDSKALILAATEETFNDSTLGEQLAHLILINNEFMIFRSMTDLGGNQVRLNDCFRGVLDSQVADHATNDRCWLLYTAGSVTFATFDSTPIAVKPQPESLTDELALGSATATNVTMSLTRHLEPYPPVGLQIGGSYYPAGTVSLDTANGSDDGQGFNMDFIRRDYRTMDEVAAVEDESSLPNDFPAANNTRYQIEVREDPDGGNNLLFTLTYDADNNDIDFDRTKILRENSGDIPSRMRLVIKTRHTVDTVDQDAQDVTWDFDTESTELENDDNLGVLDENVTSASYAAPDTGNYAFTLLRALSSGDIEARVNGGSWNVIISSGNTSGSLVGVTATDTIEVRHTESGADTDQTLLTIDAPTSSNGAYAVIVI